MKLESIALFGGSFDPVHQGHIQIAQYIQNHFRFSKFIFLPCGTPALKPQCQASNIHRLAMLKLALQSLPQFEIDTRELMRDKTSYTIDTIQEYRQEHGEKVSISLIIGHDAFCHLMQWHRWQELLDYCHIIHHERPSQAHHYPHKLKDYVKQRDADDPNHLIATPKGSIFSIFAGNFPYSSTEIRKSLKNNQVPQGLSPQVLAYIQNHHLYHSL
jgi:nicotinate-nucleotide adenylyltransferase